MRSRHCNHLGLFQVFRGIYRIATIQEFVYEWCEVTEVIENLQSSGHVLHVHVCPSKVARPEF